MNLHDPTRPKGYAEVPMYMSLGGRAIGSLHHLELIPLPDPPQNVEIRGWWRTEGRSFRCFGIILHWNELVGFLQEFEEDPERVMRERFGWSYNESETQAPRVKPSAKPGVVVNLADLGF